MLTLIVVVLAGALIGWIASKIMGTDQSMGAMANIVAGLIGAAVGRFVAPMVGMEPKGTDFSIGGLVFGILGACIVIGILKMVTGAGKTAR